MRAVAMLPVLMGAACVSPATLQGRLERATHQVEVAQRAYGTLCAPEALANAQAHLDFTRLELSQGHLARADAHLEQSLGWGAQAVETAVPCGSVDQDHDFVPDIVDACPTEPQPVSDEPDRDGCPDREPADVPIEGGLPTGDPPQIEPDWFDEVDTPPVEEPDAPTDPIVIEAAPPVDESPEEADAPPAE